MTSHHGSLPLLHLLEIEPISSDFRLLHLGCGFIVPLEISQLSERQFSDASSDKKNCNDWIAINHHHRRTVKPHPSKSLRSVRIRIDIGHTDHSTKLPPFHAIGHSRRSYGNRLQIDISCQHVQSPFSRRGASYCTSFGAIPHLLFVWITSERF